MTDVEEEGWLSPDQARVLHSEINRLKREATEAQVNLRAVLGYEAWSSMPDLIDGVRYELAHIDILRRLNGELRDQLAERSEFRSDLLPQMEAVLNAQISPRDSGVETVREYLVRLLLTLWTVGEGFSGKRPFGNSGWEYDLYQALVNAGIITATLDENGYIDEMSREERARADALIAEAIRYLGRQ